MTKYMKRLILLLAACTMIATGCPRNAGQGAGGAETPAGNAVGIELTQDGNDLAAASSAGIVGKEFTFDELFKIFSIFGSNIMTPKFAPQSVKDRIKAELKESFDGSVEFTGPTNRLEYSLFDGDCYDGFEMACYRYSADDHVLVMLLENGGCDVSSVKYIRAYEYDPETGNAHEVELPFNPAPKRDDFEDLVRLAGADVEELRGAMKAGLYDYEWRPEGALVRLNDPMDFDEHVYHGALFVDYRWNGSELVRNEDYVYPSIHADGFGSILLGQSVPNLRFDYDPVGYYVKYSEGGDLWLVELNGKDVLQIQMEFDKVYSIEVFSPKYCVVKMAYENDGKQQPRVGGRINDCIAFGTEAPQVWMLMDGTVQIEDDIWNSKIAFRAPRESLVNPPQPSANGRIRIENPKFKPDATIASILLWRED